MIAELAPPAFLHHPVFMLVTCCSSRAVRGHVNQTEPVFNYLHIIDKNADKLHTAMRFYPLCLVKFIY